MAKGKTLTEFWAEVKKGYSKMRNPVFRGQDQEYFRFVESETGKCPAVLSSGAREFYSLDILPDFIYGGLFSFVENEIRLYVKDVSVRHYHLLQHYGGKSFHIDFSKHIGKALWFACKDRKHWDKNGLLIIYDRGNKKSFVDADHNNIRMANQESVLYFPKQGWLNLEECCVIEIPFYLKSDILKYLEKEDGITDSFMFPDDNIPVSLTDEIGLKKFIENQRNDQTVYLSYFQSTWHSMAFDENWYQTRVAFLDQDKQDELNKSLRFVDKAFDSLHNISSNDEKAQSTSFEYLKHLLMIQKAYILLHLNSIEESKKYFVNPKDLNMKYIKYTYVDCVWNIILYYFKKEDFYTALQIIEHLDQVQRSGKVSDWWNKMPLQRNNIKYLLAYWPICCIRAKRWNKSIQTWQSIGNMRSDLMEEYVINPLGVRGIVEVDDIRSILWAWWGMADIESQPFEEQKNLRLKFAIDNDLRLAFIALVENKTTETINTYMKAAMKIRERVQKNKKQNK